MNDVINASQPARESDCETWAAQDRGGKNAGHNAPARPHSHSNWAWATATSQYDWMDIHAPFSTLD
jgi:hypothetical protein